MFPTFLVVSSIAFIHGSASFTLPGARIPVPRDSCLKLPSLRIETKVEILPLLFSLDRARPINISCSAYSLSLAPTKSRQLKLPHPHFCRRPNLLKRPSLGQSIVRAYSVHVDPDSRAGLFSRPSGKHCRQMLAWTHSSSVLDLLFM